MKFITPLIAAIIFGLLFMSYSKTFEKGLLHGKVNIGPISPVEQPGQTPTLLCEVYDARKIMIFEKSGNNLLKQLDINCNTDENHTRYRVELEPDIYIIDINRLGVYSSSDVPKQIEI